MFHKNTIIISTIFQRLTCWFPCFIYYSTLSIFVRIKIIADFSKFLDPSLLFYLMFFYQNVMDALNHCYPKLVRNLANDIFVLFCSVYSSDRLCWKYPKHWSFRPINIIPFLLYWLIIFKRIIVEKFFRREFLLFHKDILLHVSSLEIPQNQILSIVL